MKVLVACEFSGIVRNAFAQKGHYAVSCDLILSETEGMHWLGDVLKIIDQGWDMMIAHPPYTHLAVSGARWFKYKRNEQKSAIEFFMALINAPIERIAVENPVSIMSTRYRKPDQIIQPWQFGHGETKATCLWLKNLPKLQSTKFVDGREQRIHLMPPSVNRAKLRSITYSGIANAMAEQWNFKD